MALILSVIKDKQKTIKSLKTAWKVFLNISPLLFVTIALVSLVLYYLPDYVIAQYLGTSDSLLGMISAALLGSISLLPGFITFPLSGLLLNQGVSYTVLSTFTTTLMMVGVLTFPMERKFFGTKIALLRNGAGLVIALLVSLLIGLSYGEFQVK
ncbi:MAG: permease [Spirochaetales bacterium]|nr:permease [Spirochaetales bacterium]